MRTVDKDIHHRIYKFVISCFGDVITRIPHKPETNPIISQISASLTSIGANDQEADVSSSRKDFIAKYGIVRKEAKETVYWLNILRDLHFIPKETIQPHIHECEEIFLVVSSILKSAQRNGLK